MSVLVLSNRADATADYLCMRMREAGRAHVRLDTEAAASMCTLSASPRSLSLRVGEVAVTPQEISTVWYRRPSAVAGPSDADGPERAFVAAEWTAGIEGFLHQIPMQRWVNHPGNIVTASAKLEQLVRAEALGLSVPSWCCTTSRTEALVFLKEHQRIIGKPLYAGYIERAEPASDTVIYTTRVREEHLRDGEGSLGAPTLFQREVTNATDIRVTLVDDDVIAMRLWRDDDDAVDIRRNNMLGVRYERQKLPTAIEEAVRGLIRSYGLRFAAVDMMVTGDNWHFLEVNPNGQWAWLDLVGGADIYKAFLRAFEGDS